mmetsp:Transcript_52575/g.77917  ORF Transcript_52575/g.77917 Transcript_52575/m.77917 type:complete len:164 (-) Transcript_52575:180-671(-)
MNATFTPVPFETGSARRPKRGAMYGANYVSQYKEDLQLMFDRGVEDIRKRMSAATMLRALQEKYPNEFALPNESHIKQAISRMKAQRQRQNTGTSSRYWPKPEHIEFFNEIAPQNMDIELAFQEFRKTFNLQSDEAPNMMQFTYQLSKTNKTNQSKRYRPGSY